MGDQQAPTDDSKEIPEDATVLTQVSYAWVWSTLPYTLMLGALYLIFPAPEIIALIMIIILVLSYFAWRGTAYIFTADTLIYQRGAITGARRYEIPLIRLRNVRARYGILGRALGYQSVDIIFDDGAVASLKYLPILDEIAPRIQELIDDVVTEDHQPHNDKREQPDDGNGSVSSADEPPNNEPPNGEFPKN